MYIEYVVPQQNINPNETVVAQASDGTQLILNRDLAEVNEADDGTELKISLSRVDYGEGLVRFRYDDGTRNDMEFEKFFNARLAYGLWLRCGPFDQPESSNAVPRKVATDGQDAITAYIHLNNGYTLARPATASICDVTEQTVSDRLSRVRWTPSDNKEETDDR